MSSKLKYTREAASRVIDPLRDRSYSVGKLAETVGKSQSWTSEVVGDLEDEHLVERTDGYAWPTHTKRHCLPTSSNDTHSKKS
jgi:hypothetical protein